MADEVLDKAGGQAAKDGGEGILDKVEEVIEEVVEELLGPDAPPPEDEDPWERRARRLDSWTAIILAIAAIGTAWVSFQASQWSDKQSDAQSASAIKRSDANRAASEATTDQILDSQMWLSWLRAKAQGREQEATFFRERFSPWLDSAQKSWGASVPTDADGKPAAIPKGTPLDLPAYVVPAKQKAEALAAEAEAELAEADEAAGHATRFVLLAVVYALVLFFASITTKVGAAKVQALLLLFSIGFLVYAGVRTLLIPHTL